MSEQHPDQGFTLVEVLLVIMVLGLLSAIVVATMGGFRADAAEAGCAADRRVLDTSAEAYLAQLATKTIPATGATPDRYELTLVAERFLARVSALYDLDASGNVVVAVDSSCTV